MATLPIAPVRFSLAAFLSLGFRPLYSAGALWAAISVGIWIFAPHLLQGVLGGVWWHAHEMLWGFVGTIAVGFLTTASATWTGHNPVKGAALGGLALGWLIARIAYLIPGNVPFWIGFIAESLFFLIAAGALWRVIFKARSKRNYVLPLAILLLGISNGLYLWAVAHGSTLMLIDWLRTGILCMVFITLLIARRVIPFFASRAVAGLQIPMHERSGRVQLIACAIAIVAVLLGWNLVLAACAAVAGAIGLFQLVQWKPQRVIRVPLLWVLYLAWFFMGIGLLLAAGWFAGWRPGWMLRDATYVHVIAMGGFSIMIIGMITRTALGHTGRPLKADRSMVCCYLLVLVATIARLLALVVPGFTTPLLHLAATAWVVAFGLYLFRFVPLLVAPRPQSNPATMPTVIRPQEKTS